MLWGIRIWQIILAIILFPILTGMGIIVFRELENRDFEPQTVEQRNIDASRPILENRDSEQRQLSAARNLKGDWAGNAIFNFQITPNSSCLVTFGVTLHITSQQDNTIRGNVDLGWLKSEQRGNFACQPVPPSNDPVNGTVTGSRLALDAGQQGAFTGSFTTDTITLNQPKDADGDGLESPIHLLRQ